MTALRDRASSPAGSYVWHVQQRQRRRELRARSFDDCDSPLFESDIFQQEVHDAYDKLSQLIGTIGKFGELDIEGKKLCLERFERVAEKLKVIMARVRLAKDDPLGQKMLRLQAVHLLEANTNLDMMLQGMDAGVAIMRSMVAQEEATHDPAVLAAIKQEWSKQFGVLGAMNMDAVMRDPLAAQGSMDPLALKAGREMMENPLAVEKHRDNAPLYAFLKCMVLGQHP